MRREVSHHASDGIFDRGPSRMAMADLRLRGEILEESHDHFLTIAAAVAQGAERLTHMNAVDRARAARGDSTTMRAAGAGDGRALSVSVSRRRRRC